MITVQVFYKESGKPAKQEKVSISPNNFFGGVVEAYTNDDGEAHFRDYDPGEYRLHRPVFGRLLYLSRRRFDASCVSFLPLHFRLAVVDSGL